MLAQPRRAARSRIVAIAPVFQRHHGDPDLATLVGQHVVEAMLSPAVRSTDQHALRHEVIQAIGESSGSDPRTVYPAMSIIGSSIMAPLAVASLATGLLLA